MALQTWKKRNFQQALSNGHLDPDTGRTSPLPRPARAQTDRQTRLALALQALGQSTRLSLFPAPAQHFVQRDPVALLDQPQADQLLLRAVQRALGIQRLQVTLRT